MNYFTIPGCKNETVETLVSRLTNSLGISEAELKEHNRADYLPLKRGIIFLFLRKGLGIRLQKIGINSGKFHHATVIHQMNKVKELYEFNDSILMDLINRLPEDLKIDFINHIESYEKRPFTTARRKEEPQTC